LIDGPRELLEVTLIVDKAANVPASMRWEIGTEKSTTSNPDPTLDKLLAALAGVPDTVTPQRGCQLWAQLSRMGGTRSSTGRPS
jgi:hypothetical protein